MDKTEARYTQLLGTSQGARKLHVHLTELDPAVGWKEQHAHAAEEALYMLEGLARFTFQGKTREIGPGEIIFFPSGVQHAEATFVTPKAKYLVLRSIEPDDTCCCETKDRESAEE